MKAVTLALILATPLFGCTSTTTYVREAGYSYPCYPPDFWTDAYWWKRTYDIEYLWPKYHGDKGAFAYHIHHDPAWQGLSGVAIHEIIDALE